MNNKKILTISAALVTATSIGIAALRPMNEVKENSNTFIRGEEAMRLCMVWEKTLYTPDELIQLIEDGVEIKGKVWTVDEDGRIYLFNPDTLEIKVPIGDEEGLMMCTDVNRKQFFEGLLLES